MIKKKKCVLSSVEPHRVHRWRVSQLVGVRDDVFVYARNLYLPDIPGEKVAVFSFYDCFDGKVDCMGRLSGLISRSGDSIV